MKIDPSHLLDAAQSVFARDGLERGSIRAIAREAGCDPSLLYYHFENKEVIFAAILERKFGKMLPALENIANIFARQQGGIEKVPLNAHGRTALQEAIWQVLQTYRNYLKDDASFRGIIRGNVALKHSYAFNELKKYISHAIKIISDLFRTGVLSGELRKDIDPTIITFFFMRTCAELMDSFPFFSSIFLTIPPEEALELAEKQWFRLFWAGVSNT